MKKLYLGLVLLFVVLLGGGCFVTFPAKYSETEQLSVAVPEGGTLHLSTQNGAIRVRSGDVKEAQITAEKTVRSRTEEEAKRICQETKIETDTQTTGASVSVVLPEDYRLRAIISVGIEAIVPESCSLDLSTSNGKIEAGRIKGRVEMRTSNGGIEVEDIAGDVFADTSNGGVELGRVSGSVDASTSNGNVTVREVSGDIRCRTSNGAIELFNVVANAEVVTSNGNITCLLPGDASATVSGSTANGKVSSHFPLTIRHNELSGKIGDGKFQIRLRTTNGHISLERIE